MTGVCAVTVGGRELLASASYDESVRIWDPATGEELRRLEGHTDIPFGLCTVTVGGQELLASTGLDRTLRLWDLTAGLCLMSVPVHHLPLAVVQISDLIVIGLSAGLLGIDVAVA